MKQIVCNTAQVKSNNKEVVKNALKSLSNGTKTTIARITGLSVATCNTILNELATAGEILEVESDNIGEVIVGRPAKAFRFNENYEYICCINLGFENKKKKLSYAIVDLLGNVVEKVSSEEDVIDYDVLESIIGKLLIKYHNIKAVGVGIPGVSTRKNVIDFCDIEELSNCPLSEKLMKKFALDVVIDNDMNLIAYGVYQECEYKEDTSIAAVSFFKDNLPGAGIIVDGHIIHGDTNFAGEVSFLPFGCTKEEQKELLKNREGNIQIVSKTIASIAAIINPTTVIITGTTLEENMVEEIYQICSGMIPQRHIPNIRFVENVDEFYLKGISSLTLEYRSNLIHKAQKNR
ncbi:MAG: hypothetical protein K0R15_936 [Clostridiales bacterium]|jgi:predicted NBD/HSP70 family sugar kinase|nr:hypothetical protein [Clostridiales bacterium]